MRLLLLLLLTLLEGAKLQRYQKQDASPIAYTILKMPKIALKALKIGENNQWNFYPRKRCTIIVAEMRRGSLWLLWVFLLEVASAQVTFI